MISFSALLLKFNQQGEKTGWTYIEISATIAGKIKPDFKRSFRVKGFIDQLPISGVALIPVGDGDFIMPVNSQMRKAIGKTKGIGVVLSLEEDHDFVILIPEDLTACLEEDEPAQQFFLQLSPSHRNYFIKWIDSAKTIETRNKRIVQTMSGLSKQLSYGEMIRLFKQPESNA